MASESSSPLLACLEQVASSDRPYDLTDGELLQRFAAESAFTELLLRHGPMVLGLCRSILLDGQDAEDAFQATFLVLVRKLKSIGKPTSLAGWLHGVAYRLAIGVRLQAARRRVQKRQGLRPKAKPQDEGMWRDLRPVLHQEVERMPERYRLPFVLCYLEGETNEKAAHLVGRPTATVAANLSRAWERLRRRLTRRGLTLTGSLLAAVLRQGAARANVPATLIESTSQAALLFATGSGSVGAVSASVLAYAESMLQATFLDKLKLLATIFLALSALVMG